MPKAKDHPKSPVDAVQQVYDALNLLMMQQGAEFWNPRARYSECGWVLWRKGPESPASQSTDPFASSSAPLGARPVSPVELIQEKQPVTNAQGISR
jgi:hypothetical protein